MQTTALYGFLRDFAGPVATVLAALGAFYLGWRFGTLQAKATKAQADIALDKLKFDLFEKRYEIYSAAKTLIEKVIHVRSLDKCDPDEIRSLHVKIDESRFFFPPDIQMHLRHILSATEKILTLVGARHVLKLEGAEWASTADEIGRVALELQGIYAGLPKKFEGTLAFQLVTKQQVSATKEA